MKNLNSKSLVVIIIAVIMVLALAAFLLLFRSLTEAQTYDKYISAAQLAMENNDYDNALASLRKAAGASKNDECLLMMSQCYEQLGNYDKALDTLYDMDTNDPAVKARITALEARKKNSAGSGAVMIAGGEYPLDSTSLVLDGKGLNSSVIGEIVQLYSIDNLSLADNQLGSLSGLEVLGGLTTLNLSNNSVTDLSPLSGLSSLRTLYLDGNPITDFSPLYNLPNLTFLSIKGIEVTESAMKALSTALPNCAVNGADASADAHLIALGGRTFDADTSEPLDLSNLGITDISALSQCRNLTSVNLSGNQISDISPLMEIQYLNTVNISNNYVTDIRPLMGISGLRILYASGNSITSTVSLGANTSLIELDLSFNPIGDFSGLKKLKNLNMLNLSNTGLRPDDIENFKLLSKLYNLDITNNTEISGEAYEQLQAMIPKCQITHSELTYNFSFGGSDIPSDTTTLDLPGRGISDLEPLNRFNNLQYINLSNNNISNLFFFSTTSCRESITYLNLADNEIIDLAAISYLTNLQVLNLTNNSIYSVTPLYGLTNLRELYIAGNQLSEEQLVQLNSFLPNCTIIAD